MAIKITHTHIAVVSIPAADTESHWCEFLFGGLIFISVEFACHIVYA